MFNIHTWDGGGVEKRNGTKIYVFMYNNNNSNIQQQNENKNLYRFSRADDL